MRIFMEGLFPGRWDTLRPVKPKEIKARSGPGLRDSTGFARSIPVGGIASGTDAAPAAQ